MEHIPFGSVPTQSHSYLRERDGRTTTVAVYSLKGSSTRWTCVTIVDGRGHLVDRIVNRYGPSRRVDMQAALIATRRALGQAGFSLMEDEAAVAA